MKKGNLLCLGTFFLFLGLTACNLDVVNQGLSQKPKFLNFTIDSKEFKSSDPISPAEALLNIKNNFVYNSISGNFKNYPREFNSQINTKGEHYYNQRFFIKDFGDTLMVDLNIEFPIIGGEGVLLKETKYPTGLFLRDGALDLSNVTSATVWAGKCPVPEFSQPSISLTFWGKRKTDGLFGITKYWQTIKSVPHNDNGEFVITKIDIDNKTIEGSFNSTISNIYINATQSQLNSMQDPYCKKELYKVETKNIKGEFFLDLKTF